MNTIREGIQANSHKLLSHFFATPPLISLGIIRWLATPITSKLNFVSLRTHTKPMIDIGFYGEEGKLEWEQYQLSEPGLHKPDSCPIETSAKPILQNDKTKFGEFAKESATPCKLM